MVSKTKLAVVVGTYIVIFYFKSAKNVVSNSVLLAEFLDLTLEDVDKCIELIFTPIRKDALKGSSRSILSCQVAPGMSFAPT